MHGVDYRCDRWPCQQSVGLPDVQGAALNSVNNLDRVGWTGPGTTTQSARHSTLKRRRSRLKRSSGSRSNRLLKSTAAFACDPAARLLPAKTCVIEELRPI